MLIANDMNALEETLAPQPDSSISDSRMAYQVYVHKHNNLPHMHQQNCLNTSNALQPSNKEELTYLCTTQDFGGHYDEEIPSFLQDIPENENHHWQIDIFNNMHIDEVNIKNNYSFLHLFQCAVNVCKCKTPMI